MNNTNEIANRLLYRAKVLLLFLLLAYQTKAQSFTSSATKKEWKAQWIAAKNNSVIDLENATKAGVYKFRKTVELQDKPASFIIYVSADNRYKLFVNGHLVSLGPARGDLYFWNYETVDISPYLQKGKNIIAALVWNLGALRPEAQISFKTGFIIQGATTASEIVNTDTSWKAAEDSSYQFFKNKVQGYYVAGPGEVVDMQKDIRDWKATTYNDQHWPSAITIAKGFTKETANDWPGWMLVPSALPQMELKEQRFATVRTAQNISVPASFIAGKNKVVVPAHTQATILLDQSFLTNAYPTLAFSKGKGANITLTCAEALYVPDTTAREADTLSVSRRFKVAGKGNRNEVLGKVLIGTKDSIISDGIEGQKFSSLWWRTYRYVQIKIETKEDPLVLDDVLGIATGYPFKYKASFESSDSLLLKMLNIGWRTARLCAMETYMDCPYYEQLQYIGDARIQGLVSIYNSGDDRLLRNALTQFDHSRIAEGLTLSRWPSVMPQQIPTFSLWYIGMLHDYWWYQPDAGFVKEKLAGMRQILWWFSHYQTEDGSLKNVPYWNYTDYLDGKGWVRGIAPIGKNGHSAALDLQLCWAYQLAATLEKALGLPDLAKQYEAAASHLKTTIIKRYWNAAKSLFADTEEKDLYSQHTNSLAILCGLINGQKSTALARKILEDTSLAQASIYFKFYVHGALVKAGLGNDYLTWLGVWKENMRLGLTTWAEMSDVANSRSDCHAWGCSPNIEFFRTVLGIDSDAPGFKKVKIEPHLGALKNAAGTVPLHSGNISVNYVANQNHWTATIQLPKNTTGIFIWQGKKLALKSGLNEFVF